MDCESRNSVKGWGGCRSGPCGVEAITSSTYQIPKCVTEQDCSLLSRLVSALKTLAGVRFVVVLVFRLEHFVGKFKVMLHTWQLHKDFVGIPCAG